MGTRKQHQPNLTHQPHGDRIIESFGMRHLRDPKDHLLKGIGNAMCDHCGETKSVRSMKREYIFPLHRFEWKCVDCDPNADRKILAGSGGKTDA